MAYTFGAEDILSALGVTAADFEVQESGSDRAQDWAGTKDKVGLHLAAAAAAHNDRTEKTVTIKCKDPDSSTAVAFTLGGAGTADVVITQFSARQTYNDNATLTVTAHKHETTESGAAHAAAPVAEAVSLVLGFGVSAVNLGGTLEDCQSAELSGSVEHKDRFSNKGKFLVGASTGLRFEATEEYIDDGSDITVPEGWFQDSQAKRTVNEDFYTRVVRAHCFELPVEEVPEE